MKRCLGTIRPIQHPVVDLLRRPQPETRPAAQLAECARKTEVPYKPLTTHQTLSPISQDTHDQITILQGGWSHANGHIHCFAQHIHTPVGRLEMERDAWI